jgi:hypothetical protein
MGLVTSNMQAALWDLDAPPPKLAWYQGLRGNKQLAVMAASGGGALICIVVVYEFLSWAWSLASLW